MNQYEFLLVFALPNHDDNPERYLNALYEAGCDDASIGIGIKGMIGFDFTKRAASAEDAIRTAISSVQTVIPDAVLVIQETT